MSRRWHPPDNAAGRQRALRVGRPTAADAPTVVDNWPGTVPVTARERHVVETYLGALLDQLLQEVAPDD